MKGTVNLSLAEYEKLNLRIKELKEENRKLEDSFAYAHDALGFTFYSKEEVEKKLEIYNLHLENRNKMYSDILKDFMKKWWFKKRYGFLQDYLDNYLVRSF
jgi:hypothetical protein